jgi:hypothetical protein
MRVEDLEPAHEKDGQRDHVDPVHDSHRGRVPQVDIARCGSGGGGGDRAHWASMALRRVSRSQASYLTQVADGTPEEASDRFIQQLVMATLPRLCRVSGELVGGMCQPVWAGNRGSLCRKNQALAAGAVTGPVANSRSRPRAVLRPRPTPIADLTPVWLGVGFSSLTYSCSAGAQSTYHGRGDCSVVSANQRCRQQLPGSS